MAVKNKDNVAIYYNKDDFFNKKEIWPWIFGAIDLTIFGIGAIVTILWLGSIKPHEVSAKTTPWVPSTNSAKIIAKDNNLLINTSPKTTIITTNVCIIDMALTTSSGKKFNKEYKGNCADIKARAADAKGKVVWLQVQTFKHASNI